MALRSLIRHPVRLTAGLFLLVLLLLVLLGWLFRTQLAEFAVERWCHSNALTCTADVTSVGPGGVETGKLRIETADGEVPFSTNSALIRFDWSTFPTPAVSLISLSEPVVRGRYRPGQPLQFGGLEDFAGGEGTGMLPEVRIDNATFELDTPAGPVRLHGTLSGQLPLQAELAVRIDPVSLKTGEGELVLEEGHAELTLTGLKLDGEARFSITEARFDGLTARDFVIEAEMADNLRPTVNWSLQAHELSGEDFEVSDTQLEGSISLKAAKAQQEIASLEWLQAASLTGRAAAARWQGQSAGQSDVTLDITRENSAGLTSDFAIKLSDFSREDVEAGQLTLSGTGTIDNTASDVKIEADLVAEKASIPDKFRRTLLPAQDPDGTLSGHVTGLTQLVDRALKAFNAGTGLRFEKTAEPGWSLVTTRAVSLQGANGLTLAARPLEDTRPIVNFADDGIEVSGLFSLTGPDGLDLSALVKQARYADKRINVETGGVSLAPWMQNGLTLGAELNEVSYTSGDAGPRLRLVGDILLDGAVAGLEATNTRIFGGFDAAMGEAGLRVQTYRTACLGLDSDGIELGNGRRLLPVALELCPVDGRVVRRARGRYVGTLAMGSARLPFESQNTSGTLSLEKALLDWSAADMITLDISAEAMTLPLELGEKTLTIRADAPRIGFSTTEEAELSATVGPTEFSGTLIPAAISLDEADFSAFLAEKGLNGRAHATRVEVRDQGADPLFEPLYGDLDAQFTNGIMALSGPFTTARAGQRVATANMSLDLITLDGEAHIESERLTFSPNRLQPTALSDRVRGFMSNARGSLQAEADFIIDGGSPSATGRVRVQDFGFDTLRLGAVDGITGDIRFDDLLALTTPPGQELKIGALHPGIPLLDGVVTFQLKDGIQVYIEDASWPFAGGTLRTGGSEWTIAGTSDTVIIEARALELTEIINVLDLPDIEARGTVSGTFPVEISGPNAYVRDARLTADDQGGTLAYTGGVGEQAAKADERVSMAFQALRDFRFSVLQLGIDGNLNGDMLITLRLVGVSPEVLNGAPFAFNIGIDTKLMQLIRTGRSLTSSDWLADITAMQRDSADGDTATPDMSPE